MKERSLIELLTILRYEVEFNLSTGMCGIIQLYGKFTKKEENVLLDYLYFNKPKHVSKKQAYWWPCGDTTPRLEWIDRQLAKLQKDEQVKKH